MKPKRLAEVRELLSTQEFRSWWEEFLSVRKDHELATQRYEEQLSQTTLMEFRAELIQKNAIDTLYRAGESEDQAASMVFEATDLENRSFRAIALFEEQRFKVSEIWYRLGAAEKGLEEKRDLNERLKNRKGEADLEMAERARQTTAAEYARETQVKDQLWEDVERIWIRSTEVGLLVSEERARGKAIRKNAEALFAQAEERKARARELRKELETFFAARGVTQARLKVLLEQARTKFGCTPGTDFLYFRHKDSPKRAFVVSLVEDPESYNVEVKALGVYEADRQRGVSFLEPSRADATAAEPDSRFEEFFLRGRKGTPRPTRV